DLRPAIGPIALDGTGPAVDQHAVRLPTIPIARQPERQQDVLKGHADVLRVDCGQLLMIATDVPAAQLADRLVHDLLGLAKALAGAEGVALGLEAAEVVGPERFEVLQLRVSQTACVIRRNAAGGADEHGIEEVPHLAADRIPARPGDGPLPCYHVAL